MKDMQKRILIARCRNCEAAFFQHGKTCIWRSFDNGYCFDGMDNDEANKEITKNFSEFQTKISRGFID